MIPWNRSTMISIWWGIFQCYTFHYLQRKRSQSSSAIYLNFLFRYYFFNIFLWIYTFFIQVIIYLKSPYISVFLLLSSFFFNKILLNTYEFLMQEKFIRRQKTYCAVNCCIIHIFVILHVMIFFHVIRWWFSLITSKLFYMH